MKTFNPRTDESCPKPKGERGLKQGAIESPSWKETNKLKQHVTGKPSMGSGSLGGRTTFSGK